MKIIALTLTALLIILPCLYGAETVPISSPNEPIKYSTPQKTFFEWINSKNFTGRIDRSEEKDKARVIWKQSIGVDIFYPYFQIKKTQKAIEDKTEIRLFRMKGRARFHEDEVKYIFRRDF